MLSVVEYGGDHGVEACVEGGIVVYAFVDVFEVSAWLLGGLGEGDAYRFVVELGGVLRTGEDRVGDG